MKQNLLLKIDRQIDRQTDRQMYKQTDRQMDRQTDKQRDILLLYYKDWILMTIDPNEFCILGNLHIGPRVVLGYFIFGLVLGCF